MRKLSLEELSSQVAQTGGGINGAIGLEGHFHVGATPLRVICRLSVLGLQEAFEIQRPFCLRLSHCRQGN